MTTTTHAKMTDVVDVGSTRDILYVCDCEAYDFQFYGFIILI